MLLPKLTATQVTREMIRAFGGLNKTQTIAENEWADMENMTADFYPAAAPRQRRRQIRKLDRPNGLFAHEKLSWVDGENFYYDGVVRGTVADGPKQMTAMGAYILIWPDRCFYNTQSGEFGSLANRVVTQGEVRAALCRADGEEYGEYICQDVEPEGAENGDLWLDTSANPQVLRQYAGHTGTWTSIPALYTAILASGIGKGFSAWDGVTISGLTDDALNGNFYLADVQEDVLVIPAVIQAALSQSEPVTVERSIPEMDFITQSENRLWGCSSKNHEIYASKLGDPKNFNCFMGLSTDSYAATVGTGGDFTGAVTHMGYVLFMKEDVIHRVYGTKPANFQITHMDVRGVEAGSEGSLCLVNETLYYKSRREVMALQSTLPESVSRALGVLDFRGACAGQWGGKYYLWAQGESGGLWVFDTRLGTWHRETAAPIRYFAEYEGRLYFLTETGELMALGEAAGDYEDPSARGEETFEWFAQSGDWGMETPDNKYLTRLQIRAQMEPGSQIAVFVSYDHGPWERKLMIIGDRQRSFTAPVIPRRCDSFRLRLEGMGEVKLLSITKGLEAASEVKA